MSSPKPCRHDLCEAPALDRAQFCGDHIGLTHRCTAEREKDGKRQRCKKDAMRGLTVCMTHGGRFPSNRATSGRAVALTAMQRFVRPREAGVTLADAFTEEFLRTLGRIDWLQAAIGGLSDEEDDPEGYEALIWGKTKTEDIGAGEEPGTNTTYEARVHILEDMLRWERTHLLAIEKLGIGAGLEQQRLDMMKNYAARMAGILERALDDLGLDKHDPKVIAALNKAKGADAPTEPIIDLKQIGPGEYA